MHERFFAAAVKHPQRPIISWLCARTAKETRVLLTIWCSQCVRYTSTRHLLCRNMFYDHTLAEIWMLPDLHIITDWARRILLCAFGTVCNKWGIFHYTIDVCPDFCDVTVKTCCILHNFVRQRDGFQLRGTLRRGSVTGYPENMLSRALEMDICFHRGPALGENGGTLSQGL